MRIILLVAMVFMVACNDNVETVTKGNESDTTANTLNKSEIINDSSRLPKDSSNVGVQH
jgi:hypothetical protein